MTNLLKTIDTNLYIDLLKDNDWIYNIKNPIKYNYNPSHYINNYLGPKSDILKEDLKLFFNDLNIKFITINDFINNMYELFQLFINDDNGIDEYLLLQTDKNKSQMWLNLLFIHYLKNTGNIDNFKNRLHFVSMVKYNAMSYGEILPNKMYNLLYLDDGMYSGTQSSGNIVNIKKICNIKTVNTIGYLTNEAKKILEQNNDIKFYYKNMIMFKENENYDKINKWLNNNRLNQKFNIRKNHVLNIFEHKMADDASIPINLINKTMILKQDFEPYYRYNTNIEYGKLEFEKDFYINENSFNHLIIPCAIPRISSEGSSGAICYPRYYTLNRYCIKNNDLLKFIEQNNTTKGGYYKKYLKYKNKYIKLKKIISK